MESVLTDLELDLREIKYLLDILSREPDLMLRKVAIRRVRQMQSHLGILLQEIEGIAVEETKTTEIKEEYIQPVHPIEPDIMEPLKDDPVLAIKPEPVVETTQPEVDDIPEEHVIEITEIHTTQVKSWGERVKPAIDIRSSLSLNDRFLYSRELFEGDMEHMDNILFQISQMESLDNVLSFLDSVITVDEENDTYQEFMDRIRKYFD